MENSIEFQISPLLLGAHSKIQAYCKCALVNLRPHAERDCRRCPFILYSLKKTAAFFCKLYQSCSPDPKAMLSSSLLQIIVSLVVVNLIGHQCNYFFFLNPNWDLQTCGSVTDHIFVLISLHTFSQYDSVKICMGYILLLSSFFHTGTIYFVTSLLVFFPPFLFMLLQIF